MANNTYTKTYSEGTSLTEAKLDTAYQSLKLDLSQTTQLTQNATAGNFLKCSTPGSAATWADPDDPKGINSIRNLGLKCTASTGALVFTMTTGAGSTPSTTDVVDIPFSSNGSTSATQYSIEVTGTKTFTLTASASLGITATSSTRIYVYAIQNATTSTGVKLAVSSRSDLDNGVAVTTTAVSASADSATVLYATAAITSVARLLGVVTAAHNSTGSWQTPTKVSISNKADVNIAATSLFNRTSAATVRIGGVAIASSSGNALTTSTSFVTVSNQSISLTTSGRPVKILCISDGGTATSYVGATRVASEPSYGIFQILRGTTTIGHFEVRIAGGSAQTIAVPASSVAHLDIVAAGTYTYKLQYRLGTSAGSAIARQLKLCAFEI